MAMMKTLLPLIVALTLVSATVPGESDRDRKFMLDWYDAVKHPLIQFSHKVMDHFVGFSKADHRSSRQGRAAPSRVIRALEGQLPQNYKVDFRLMTKAEWRDFCEAVQMVMEKKVNDSNYPNATWFDLFAANHRSAVAPSAHANAGFMAWHPCYVHAFEQLLRTEGGKPNLVMPFYDSRPDTEIPSHCDSSIYTNESIGNNQGVVANGPWKYHKVFPQDCQISTTNPYLSRACNVGCTDCMTNYAEFNTYSNTSPFRVYADYVNPFNPSYESNHNSLHVGNGGQLNIVSCASNDPFFYIMHGFVHSMFDIRMDALYTQDVQNNLTYPNGSGVNNVSRPYDKALPFNLTHQECLREAMMRDMQYIRVPATCSADADCNHRGDQNAYWCRPQTSRCAAKIRIGGSCGKGRSIYPNKACYKEEFCRSDPICDRGFCSCTSVTGAFVNKPPVP